MAVLTEYCDYFVYSPDYFIDFIRAALSRRDVPGLTNNKMQALKVTGDHPLVMLMSSVIDSGTPSVTGLLPAISVMNSDESEEGTTMGQGMRVPTVMTAEKLALLSALPVQSRFYEGLISNSQITAIQTALTASSSGELKMEVYEYYQAEKIFVSLWTHSLMELNILGALLRSILYAMRLDMIKNRRLISVKQRADGGLRNTNFGRVLYGIEFALDYRNTLRNYTVYDDEPRAIEVNPAITHTESAENSTVKLYESIEVEDETDE